MYATTNRQQGRCQTASLELCPFCFEAEIGLQKNDDYFYRPREAARAAGYARGQGARGKGTFRSTRSCTNTYATRFYSACLCALILLKKVDAVAYLIGSVASFLWIPRGLALLLGEGRRISTAHRISHQVQQLLTCY